MVSLAIGLVELFVLWMLALIAWRWPFTFGAVYVATVLLTARQRGPIYRYYLFRSWHLRVFLHRIDKPDQDRHPHNHPWDWARGVILRGGYLEYRHGATGRTIKSPSGLGGYEWLNPGDVLRIDPDVYHRIEYLRETEPTWTLFAAGPKRRLSDGRDDWGFLTAGGHVHCEEYWKVNK